MCSVHSLAIILLNLVLYGAAVPLASPIFLDTSFTFVVGESPATGTPLPTIDGTPQVPWDRQSWVPIATYLLFIYCAVSFIVLLWLAIWYYVGPGTFGVRFAPAMFGETQYV